MLLEIACPRKRMVPQEVNPGSQVSFYKNGELIHREKELHQTFYCFAVSVFNFGEVEVFHDSEPRCEMEKGAKQYYSVLE